MVDRGRYQCFEVGPSAFRPPSVVSCQPTSKMTGMFFSLALLLVLFSPLWVPAVFFLYHVERAKNRRQFSLRFLLLLMAAESMALAVSVSLYRLLAILHSMPPPADL